MNNTFSTETGFTPHRAFYGFETVVPIDYSVRLDDNLVSYPMRFAEEVKREIGRGNDLIKQRRELASRQTIFQLQFQTYNLLRRDMTRSSHHNKNTYAYRTSWNMWKRQDNV